MTCEHCATSLSAAFAVLPGVGEVSVSFPQGLATLRASEGFSAGDVVQAAAIKGYVAELQPGHAPSSRRATTASDDAFDLVVVGSGGAAFGAALRASELGAKVAMIERNTLGGTCVNIGCVPSKALIRAAEAVHRAAHPRFAGVVTQGRVDDFRELMAQKTSLVEDLRQTKYAKVLAETPGVTLVEGHGRFVAPGRVSVNGREIQAERFIVATGMRPHIADVPGLSATGYLTSTGALALDVLPTSMLVLGGRFIALELAQAFARFGCKITVVQRSGHILPTEDDDVTEELERLLVAEGISVLTGARILGASRQEGERVLELEHLGERKWARAEQILVATGRQANTDDLGLDAIGVKLRSDGTIEVDEGLETTAQGVFAAGDVIGEPAFVYTAAYEGRLAAENALLHGPASKQPRNYAPLPAVMFTDPQLATVGLNEKQARVHGIDVDVAKLPFSYVPRALAARDTRGFIKLLRVRGTDRLVGATILAPEAGDLIMEPALAIRHGIPVSELARAFHPYLTGSEAIKLAAQTFDKDVARLSCCAA